jgi:hypothetical protein
MTHSGSPSSILPRERDLFGFDHRDAERHLIADWKLPGDFEAIVSDHHSPRQKHDSWNMPSLINVSCRMADTMGFAVFPGCEVTPMLICWLNYRSESARCYVPTGNPCL